jgi:hypothetical protein
MAVSDSATQHFECCRYRTMLVLLALMVIAVGGLYLYHSGRFDAPMASLMKRPFADFVVHVIDEKGRPVTAFQMRLGSSGSAGREWADGATGQIKIPGFLIDGDGAIDVVLRADGFASSLSHFAGADREKLLGGNATIAMRRGEKVELRFRLPQGLDWPAKLTPEVYFADYQSEVRIMWQPENQRNYKRAENQSVLDLNFLNVKKVEGSFALQLAPGGEAFYVGIYHPGFPVLRKRAVYPGGRARRCSARRRSKTRRFTG